MSQSDSMGEELLDLVKTKPLVIIPKTDQEINYVLEIRLSTFSKTYISQREATWGTKRMQSKTTLK
jgi:hypothetical protein